MNLDIASLPEGPNYFCAVGQISSGFVKDVENGVSTFSFTKDTTPPVNPVNPIRPYKMSQTSPLCKYL